MEQLLGIITASWEFFVESAPYVLFGFFAAGLLKALIPEEIVARHLGANSTRAVLKASLFGIPLPLCSCGVIPAAIGLRKQGASKGASAAFLVSTPESGIDSIAISYALLDPIMTVIRPIAAFLTATVTGLLINRLPDQLPPEDKENSEKSGCGCLAKTAGDSPATKSLPPLSKRMREGVRYAFMDLLKDIGGWLLLGIGIAGLISFVVPDDFFSRYLSSEFGSLLLMLVVGIPLYICASASTPIAAAMVLKGVSPGAALVFLLAGPATNAATVTVVGKFWGKKATAVYLGAIAGCSLFLGWLTNRIYAWTGWEIMDWVQPPTAVEEHNLSIAAAVVLLILIAYSWIPLAERKEDEPFPR
jgi:uncharacterized protein